jgi:hypothetical protein
MDFDVLWDEGEEPRSDLDGLIWAAGAWSLALYIPTLIVLVL